MRAWVPLLLLHLAAACHRPPVAFDFQTSLGVAVQKADRTCLDIRNATLAAGQRLRFVAATTPQTAGELEITGPAQKACTDVDQNKPGLHHYQFKVTGGSAMARSIPAVALAGFSGGLTVSDSGATGDLDRDGQPESFRSCTSQEGVHLTVWSGKPLEGRRRWHYYYYLGYDVEANCTESETRPETP